MRSLAFILTLAFAVSSFSPIAFATKERGGGNVTQDGSLGEVGVARDSVRLSSGELRALLIPIVAKLGGDLGNLFEDLLFIEDESVIWFLNSELDARGCEFKSSVAVETRPAACQSFDSEGVTEIRIAKSFWLNATFEQKASLVLHERVRTLLFKRGVFNCEDCLYRAVLAFQAPVSNHFVTDLQRSLKANRLGVYLTIEESLKIQGFLDLVMAAACKTTSQTEYRNRVTRSSPVGVLPGYSLNETKAAAYVLWVNAANFESTCSDFASANQNTLKYWRGD